MVEVLYSESVEQIPLRWRPAWWQYHRFSQCGFVIQVGEYLVDDQGVFDTGDDFDRTATLDAGFYVDVEHPLQSNQSPFVTIQLANNSFIKITVARIDATRNHTPAVSILLVSMDNSHMNISNSLKTQRNNRLTP